MWQWLKNLFRKKQPPKDYFPQSIEFVLKWEGGYTKGRHDPGGETKYGISKRSYPKLDIKNITLDRAKDIYRTDFWEAVDSLDLHWPLNLAVFDFAVNAGPSRATRKLQQLLDKKGISGVTRETSAEIAEDYIDVRDKYYEYLARRWPKKYKRFILGWKNRTADLRRYINELDT